MAVILERQISDSEKQTVLQRYGRICYATGHVIPDDETVYYDHVFAFADGGASSVDNIAPMCKTHNEQKGRLPLEDFRAKLKIDEFFTSGEALTLKDELVFLKGKGEIQGYGNSVYVTDQGKIISLEMNNVRHTLELQSCPVTGWKYFYASVPVEYLNSDDDEEHEVGLQPRYLINEKVFGLYRHFQRHPVLQPSIARLHHNRILVFDGQHKIASLLWAGIKTFDIKIYLNPEPQLLNQTNISAHDKFAQTRFYSSIMVAKLGSQFGKQFEDYKNQEDNFKKSELGFTKFLKTQEMLSNAEVNKRFTSYLYDSVLDPSENRVAQLISKSNRGSTESPLTIDMLSKSLLSHFLYRYPVDDDLMSPTYLRDVEVQNVIRFFNIIADEGLCKWDHTKAESDTTQCKLNRMFRSKSIMAWSDLLYDAVAGALHLTDSDEKARIFYRELNEDQFSHIRFVVHRLFNWVVWTLPANSEIDRRLSDNKNEVKNYLREKGLTTGYLMGAPE